MSKSSELVQGMFINAGNVEWVKMELAFKVDQLAEMLITHKDVFEANKGYGKIQICESKGGKLYAALSTFKPTPKTDVPVEDHLASREPATQDADLPF
jgi:hypothetical protein|tara:strand:- start:211 stop:504 length:294 start_codon:yes stop_codon:yes gene_type:complete